MYNRTIILGNKLARFANVVPEKSVHYETANQTANMVQVAIVKKASLKAAGLKTTPFFKRLFYYQKYIFFFEARHIQKKIFWE